MFDSMRVCLRIVLLAGLGAAAPVAAGAVTITDGIPAMPGLRIDLGGSTPCGATGALETNLGRFSGSGVAGSGEASCGDTRRVQVKTPTTPDAFGRFDPNGGGWVDSNDLERVLWDVETGRPMRSVTFALTDAHDQPDSYFEMQVGDALWSIPSQEANGTLHLIRVLFDGPTDLQRIAFTTQHNDGFGIVGAVVQPVPLPPAALLAGSGMLAMAAVRRRRRRAA